MKKLSGNLFFVIAVLLSGCGFYSPNLRNSPMLTKAGEVQGSVQLRRGIEAQGAAAITNHIGVFSSYSYYRRVESNDKLEKRTYFDAGLGYYQNTGDTFYEIFAGYGQGDTQLLNQFSMGDGMRYSETATFRKFFIQPAIGYRKKKWSTSFVPRLSQLYVADYENTNGYSHQENRNIFLLEPAGVTRYHFNNNFFLTLQGGVAVSFVKYGNPGMLVQLGGGVGFRFNAEKN
jgi:hypothetical protein